MSSIEAQSNSPTNNSLTNSILFISTGPDYWNDEFDDANSEADCDKILQEKLKSIDDIYKKAKEAWDKAQRCDTRYEDQLTMNDLRHKATYASAANTGRGLLLTCLGLGGTAATGVAARVG